MDRGKFVTSPRTGCQRGQRPRLGFVAGAVR